MPNSKKQLSPKEALQKLASYCAYQDRCVQEVEQKLKAFLLSETEEMWVIEQLINEQFLDEQRFACTYSRSKFNHNKWGKNKIRFALKSKGIPEQLIIKGLQEINQQLYLEALEELLEKKRKTIKDTEPFKVKKKLYAYAVGKGFEADLVQSLLNQYA